MSNGRSRYYGHRFPPEIISYAIWAYHRDSRDVRMIQRRQHLGFALAEDIHLLPRDSFSNLLASLREDLANFKANGRIVVANHGRWRFLDYPAQARPSF